MERDFNIKMLNENFQQLKIRIKFICPICSEKFKQKPNVIEHLRTHYDDEAEELFKKEVKNGINGINN